ncbi:MAG TPA: hypothetical protein VJR89_30965, partial [Polyangiales bacterium]|nr:hypothetical protein [Polyangiales bacterium]
MHTAAAVRLVALSFAAAAYGCSGYSDGSGQTDEIRVMTHPLPEAPEPRDAAQQPAEPEPQHDAAQPMDAAPDARPPAADDADAGPSEPEPPPPLGNLRVVHPSGDAPSYLSDELGQALYMFAGDVPGARESACLYDCAREWPPFDVEVPQPSAELDAAEVSRFHRDDGAWQVTYKGHPLYYRGVEAGLHVVTGDGVQGKWFVARDYLAFLSTARSFAPEGGTLNGSFLTDGFGRTLYVCLDDTPATDENPGVSSCDAECIKKRPIFPAAAANRSRLLPLVIDQAALRELTRPDGLVQLMYRGWPL